MNYNYIVNPLTNRKCSIYSRNGQNVLKTYINQKGGKRGKNIPASHCSFNRFTLRCVKMNKGGIHSNCRINQNGNCAKTKEALDEFRPALRRRKEADSYQYIRRPKPKQDNRNN